MMPSITDVMCQTPAILWPAIGFQDSGEHLLGDPVGIKVRWEEGEQQTTDPKGNVIMLNASAVVDREVSIGSRMALGTVIQWEDVFSGGSAFPPRKIFRVVTQKEAADPSQRLIFRTVGLQRDKDRNPQA
jgi:hypothetical protein